MIMMMKTRQKENYSADDEHDHDYDHHHHYRYHHHQYGVTQERIENIKWEMSHVLLLRLSAPRIVRFLKTL